MLRIFKDTPLVAGSKKNAHKTDEELAWEFVHKQMIQYRYNDPLFCRSFRRKRN